MATGRDVAVFIRRARAGDQWAIVRLVLAAGINPTGLRWRRFVVAEAGGRVVGTAQLKPHRDGTLELASVAVAPPRQGEGVAGALVRALLRRARPPIYLTCASDLAGFYPRFGFRRLARAEMPRDLGRLHRLVNWALGAGRRGERLLVMRWDGPAPPQGAAG
jgi:N-acetylglutamate synthase-like GNAT family acetyltransferase